MRTLNQHGLRMRPLPSDLGMRATDDAGAPVRPLTDPDGGAPLRCCLRDSGPGSGWR